LDEEKGIRTLAEVAKRLPEDVTFRFVGDGDLRQWLEAELAAEISAGQVVVTGWVDHEQVPEELSRMRLLVMPSAPTEGLPTVILEAMACGTPVLATPVAGVPDVVNDGETGYLIKNKSLEDRLLAIRPLLFENELKKVSEASRALILREYTRDAAIRRYTMMLNTINRMGSGRITQRRGL